MARFGDAVFINQCLAYRTVWSGSFNRSFRLKVRLDTNYLMKERIHALISPRHRDRTPHLSDVWAYMHLHWAAVALMDGYVGESLSIVRRGIFSLPAWRLLFRAARFRRQTWDDPSIRRIPLAFTGRPIAGGRS
jgi:hypothetical protein